MAAPYRLGIDVGSTTIKIAAVGPDGGIAYGRYERHRSDVRASLARMLHEALPELEAIEPSFSARCAVTGSGGVGAARVLGLPFVQEVVAMTSAVERHCPGVDVAIELGGEDAKITYLTGGLEQRMNGSCAGGTGAFIDQMATLLGVDAAGLDELAQGARTIHPIAARCGVFAKADIQPLLNEGARREDIAASVLQAVVNQTISALACGRPIRGRVALLGGPLHFLPAARERFALTLGLEGSSLVTPESAHLLVALGAALEADGPPVVFADLVARSAGLGGSPDAEVRRLEPLFSSVAELEAFKERHARARLPEAPLGEASGPCFLGLDAGSTTTKLCLVDAGGRILWQSYEANGGEPAAKAADSLLALLSSLPPAAHIARSCATGYGEALFKAAFGVDSGEVETVAHCRAVREVAPDAGSVLDIGGQDMKFISVRDGAVRDVSLNEACSSGCGSFLETFARSLDKGAEEFSSLALLAESPVDLGSRCTVFMNSRVKQAQKEGATVGDIAAGLAFSVIRNALQKVMKFRDPSVLGGKAVVQGGTFSSDAVLRAFEILTGAEAVRPSRAGLMGAYGAALLARDEWEAAGRPAWRTGLAGIEELAGFRFESAQGRCGLCTNDCRLSIGRFSGPGPARPPFVTGNRCERGSGKEHPSRAQEGERPPNLYRKKLSLLFDRPCLPPKEAPRGVVGMPRALNLYEDYPFWHAFFTETGFSIALSPMTNRGTYEAGMETIPSESVCYPGKLVHGHVAALLASGVRFIFYPCVPRQEALVEGQDDRFHCPIVASYPEVALNNIDALRSGEVDYRDPFLPMDDDARLAERLYEELGDLIPSRSEIARGVAAGRAALDAFRAAVSTAGDGALAAIGRTGARGIVLAGRPYHLDPEINHGLADLASSLGWAVLTEDSVAHLGSVERPLRVVDQWSYHSRLYAAASFASRRDDIEFVQLNSFGCGLDAVTTDQVEEILGRAGKLYACIKIDEHSNLGAARIRLRSLRAAAEERARTGWSRATTAAPSRPVFQRSMRSRFKILAPQMSPPHFFLLEEAFRLAGYDLEVLGNCSHEDIDEGLRHVNNDACYPSIMVAGQLLRALKSGRYDPDATALIISQTGGGCRATNYIAFIRKALADSGLGRVPVISLNASGLEGNPGFRVRPALILRAIAAISLGDLLMAALNRTRPYEAERGSALALRDAWLERARRGMSSMTPLSYARMARSIVADFDALPLFDGPRKPVIGVVGEILVKFHPFANGDVVGAIEAEGCEASVPGLLGFFLYCAHGPIYRERRLSGSALGSFAARLAIAAIEAVRAPAKRAMARSERLSSPETIFELAAGVNGIVQLGNTTGEGWFLTAEMVALLEGGASGIACVQPFACLPNHVTGKGMIKELRRRYPGSAIAAIDYDPGASEVNQLNRLKLLCAAAKRRASAVGE